MSLDCYQNLSHYHKIAFGNGIACDLSNFCGSGRSKNIKELNIIQKEHYKPNSNFCLYESSCLVLESFPVKTRLVVKYILYFETGNLMPKIHVFVPKYDHYLRTEINYNEFV